jgi:5-methylcytosine-specific restriction endonuclease McrA
MLCGSQTIRGDSNRAATIGHIVPLNNPLNLTHGHSASNTFTNCAACNRKQGNAVMIDGHQNYADPRAVYLEHIRRLGYPLAERCRFPQSPGSP